mgnify:CR=1 FL=1
MPENMNELENVPPDVLTQTLAPYAQFLWVLQIIIIFHVYQTGRPYWWIPILLFAPGIGAFAYIIFEIIPSSYSTRGLIYSLKPRKWRIQDLREQVEENDTVDNRLALAHELYEAGDVTQALSVAEECLRGVFKDDPHTALPVVRYKISLQQYEEANALLSRLDPKNDRILAVQLAVLRGDALIGLQRYSEAEESYQNALSSFIGEAPRFGLSVVYENTNRLPQAIQLWEEIRHKFRKASPEWRNTERRWYKLASNKLKSYRR